MFHNIRKRIRHEVAQRIVLSRGRELPKAGPITGVKSYQGSRIGRCGWITSFLRKKYFLSSGTIQLKRKKEVRKTCICCLIMSVLKTQMNTKLFGGDALGGNTRSHPEHDG